MKFLKNLKNFEYLKFKFISASKAPFRGGGGNKQMLHILRYNFFKRICLAKSLSVRYVVMAEKIRISNVHDDTSGVCPGGKDIQAADVLVKEVQLLVRDNSARTTGQNNPIHCCSCGKSFKRVTQKYTLCRRH